MDEVNGLGDGYVGNSGPSWFHVLLQQRERGFGFHRNLIRLGHENSRIGRELHRDRHHDPLVEGGRGDGEGHGRSIDRRADRFTYIVGFLADVWYVNE